MVQLKQRAINIDSFREFQVSYLVAKLNRGDVLNEAFATELFDLMASNGPDYWIYGHHHCNTLVFAIGPSQLLTNQLGYVDAGEQGAFSRHKTIAPAGDY